MKYVRYVQYDYLQFSREYDMWGLNQSWAIAPSIWYVICENMGFIIYKDHDKEFTTIYIHPPWRPSKSLSCKFS